MNIVALIGRPIERLDDGRARNVRFQVDVAEPRNACTSVTIQPPAGLIGLFDRAIQEERSVAVDGRLADSEDGAVVIVEHAMLMEPVGGRLLSAP